jgi:hypothetical protein
LIFFPPTEFIQPQNLWPYIQQNLIQQNHLANPAFITNGHHHPHHLHPNVNNLAAHANNGNGSESNGLSCSSNNNNNSPEHHAVDSRDNKVIAKPLPSRPFMHHGINHPHLHSLLAHCRNPYMTGSHSGMQLILAQFQLITRHSLSLSPFSIMLRNLRSLLKQEVGRKSFHCPQVHVLLCSDVNMIINIGKLNCCRTRIPMGALDEREAPARHDAASRVLR